MANDSHSSKSLRTSPGWHDGAMGSQIRNRGDRALLDRDRELAELAAGLEDAIGGRGRLVLIAGEPGIGKTALAENLAIRAVEREVRVLWGRCWEGGGAPPYWPWVQIIRALAEDCEDDTLAAYLDTGASYVAQLVPEVADRTGQGDGAVASVESEAGRFYLFEAAARLFRNASSDKPLLLLFDDLHAADSSSLWLLRFLVPDLPAWPLMVLGAYRDLEAKRPGHLPEALTELARHNQRITLPGLDREGVGRLLEQLSERVPSEERVAFIHDITEGNPLFVQELVQTLRSEAPDRPGRVTVPVPESVRVVIDKRLAPLSADAVQVLSAAAVVGRAFDLSLLGAACDLPMQQVLGALSEATDFGVVTEEPGTIGLYRFSHPLMREVVYERLPIPARVELHRRVGEAIETRYGKAPGAHLAELAHHFAAVAAVGGGPKALEYARRAGDRAMATFAYEEAAAQYERALRVLEFAGPHEALRCELLLRLGEARSRAGDHEQARANYLQAAEISRTSGTPEQLGNAALGYGEPQVEGGLVDRRLVSLLEEALGGLSQEDSPLRARLLARLSLEMTFSEGMERRDSLSQQAVAMAARVGDPTARSGALRARWMAVWGPAGLDERSTIAEEILRLARETGDRATELAGRARRTASSIEAGQIHAAEADIAAHARLAGELRMPFHRWTAASMQAMGVLLRGDLGGAEKLADEALSMQPERPNARFAHLDQLVVIRWEQGRLRELREVWREFVEQSPGVGFARGWLSLADAEQGRGDDAQRGLRSLIDDIPRLPRDGLWLPALALASLLAARLEAADGAASLYPLLLPYADRTVAITMPHPVVCLGSVSLYLALLAAVAFRWDEANSHFQTALRVNDRLGAAAFLAPTRYEYARMLMHRGQAAERDKALQLLDQALAAARRLGLAGVAQEISTLREIGTGGTVTGVDDEASAMTERHVFRREGDFWTVAYGGSVVRVRDSKGLRYLARLLAHPAREFHVIDLEAGESQAGQGARSKRSARAAAAELQVRPHLGDAGELLDAKAKAAYGARLEELRAELDEAEQFSDAARAARSRQEIEFLEDELARAVGLRGRDRRAAAHAERARLNVTRAIRAGVANLARVNPSLGQHLGATVRTGRYCSYMPDPRTPIAWQL
jgi:tetratricopeptide (TPR) repeat protein